MPRKTISSFLLIEELPNVDDMVLLHYQGERATYRARVTGFRKAGSAGTMIEITYDGRDREGVVAAVSPANLYPIYK